MFVSDINIRSCNDFFKEIESFLKKLGFFLSKERFLDDFSNNINVLYYDSTERCYIFTSSGDDEKVKIEHFDDFSEFLRNKYQDFCAGYFNSFTYLFEEFAKLCKSKNPEQFNDFVSRCDFITQEMKNDLPLFQGKIQKIASEFLLSMRPIRDSHAFLEELMRREVRSKGSKIFFSGEIAAQKNTEEERKRLKKRLRKMSSSSVFKTEPDKFDEELDFFNITFGDENDENFDQHEESFDENEPPSTSLSGLFEKSSFVKCNKPKTI